VVEEPIEERVNPSWEQSSTRYLLTHQRDSERLVSKVLIRHVQHGFRYSYVRKRKSSLSTRRLRDRVDELGLEWEPEVLREVAADRVESA
jgi:hypothetical protein